MEVEDISRLVDNLVQGIIRGYLPDAEMSYQEVLGLARALDIEQGRGDTHMGLVQKLKGDLEATVEGETLTAKEVVHVLRTFQRTQKEAARR